MKSNYRLLTKKEYCYYTYEQIQSNTTKIIKTQHSTKMENILKDVKIVSSS